MKEKLKKENWRRNDVSLRVPIFVVKDRLEVYKMRLLTAVVVLLAAPELPRCKGRCSCSLVVEKKVMVSRFIEKRLSPCNESKRDV